MEVMEEGNLMDRVPILLQRDMQFYQTHQRVLQEPICSAVVGGKLDFPRYASFAAIKMILWWEDEYFAAYRKYSGLLHKEKSSKNSAISVKSSDPEKFVSLVTKSADLLLEHLHILSQEALDHADLSVLSATIGAASLIKNCLNVYMLAATVKFCVPKGDEKGGALKLSHKQYSEMSEALAERLLDLHCRLLLLYIIQDADCLNWEDKDAFFESERGSYTIQMWWHYMKGTKDDLWNSIPPKMAERIFAGILNETLSVLTVRYSQNVISPERTRLHLDDICNMLFCIAELLQYVCERGEAYIGLNISNQSVIVRDIHSKCKELFFCLLLQGAPLGVLSKVFRKGLEDMSMFQSRNGLPSSWIVFALQRYFNQGATSTAMNGFLDLSANMAVLLELKVMLAAPEADWSYLLKTLLMRDAVLVKIILTHLLKCLPAPENFKDVSKFSFLDDGEEAKKCEAFLCRGECFNIFQMIDQDNDPVGQSNYQIVLSVSYLLLCVGKSSDIKAALIRPLETISCNGKWSDCLDKREVWNQKRPPWLEAIMHFVYPILDSVIELLIGAVETGATMYQAMSLALTCISELWDCIPKSLYNITELLQGIIPVSTKPLSDSVLIQIIFAALYTQLTITADKYKAKDIESKSSICSTLAAAICYIDEDDKHTDQIQLFLKQAQESLQLETDSEEFKSYAQSVRDVSAASTAKIDNTIIDMDRINYSPCSNYGAAGGNGIELDMDLADYVAEVHTSEILMSKIGRQALKVSYNYLKHNMQWLVEQLSGIVDERNSFQCIRGQNISGSASSVAKSMFFIEDIPFDRHLAGSFKIDYIQWLQTPLSLNPERAWLHLSRRSDFQENAKLSLSDMAMVARICNIMKKHS